MEIDEKRWRKQFDIILKINFDEIYTRKQKII